MLCSEVQGAKLAFAESASHELLGNDVDILVLLHEHEVGLEVGEAELVKSDEGGLEALLLLLGLLEVELLWRLCVDADHALHEGAAGLLDGRLLDSRLLGHIFVASGGGVFLDGGDWILGNHLHGLAINGFDQVGLLLLYSDWLNGGLDAENIAVDLVAELDLARLHSEEGGVATLLLRCLELHLKFVGGAWHDLTVDGDDLG